MDVVRWAASRREPLAVSGGGNRAPFGHPVAADHALHLAALTGIRHYDARELVLTARAGTPVAEIEDALARHGQHLAFEPPHPGALFGGAGAGTLGGLFLANQSGPRRVHAGAARDHLLGVRAVNGRGETWKAGGKVIKNVTGYDLPRLLCGSWGTLAAVTELTCKVLPAPAASTTVAIPAPDAAEATVVLGRLAAGAVTATGLAWLPASRRCLVRFEGTGTGVAERVRACGSLLRAGTAPVAVLDDEEARATWRDVRDAVPVAHRPVVVKIALPPAVAPTLCELLTGGGVSDWYLDCGGAWLWAGLDTGHAVEVIGTLRNHLAGNGSVVIMRAPDDVKAAVGVFTPPPAALAALTARIRDSFDPLGLLNPGRLYPA